MAVKEMRGMAVRGRKLQVDFASRECQDAFFAHLEKSGSNAAGERSWDRREAASAYETRWVSTSPKHGQYVYTLFSLLEPTQHHQATFAIFWSSIVLKNALYLNFRLDVLF